MSIISEGYEAKRFPDLYDFEEWCIDFLRNIKELREQGMNEGTASRHETAIDAGEAMFAKIPVLLKELRGLSDG